MESSMNIDDILNDYSRFTYLEELINISTSNENLNTLELFTFGTIDDYYTYHNQYNKLSSKQIVHLIELTLWNLISVKDGADLKFSSIWSKGLEQALKELNELDQRWFIEALLIQMNGDSIDIRIDQENDRIQVIDILKLRDIYDASLYSARVLDTSHIMSIDDCKIELNHWLTNIRKVTQEYSPDARSRKRKTSDNFELNI